MIKIKRSNLKPNEAIVVGDSLEKDIQGAKNANIKSAWYNPKQKVNDTAIVPDYEIKNLLELKNMFM